MKKKPWIYLFSPQTLTFNTKSWRSKREKDNKSNFKKISSLASNFRHLKLEVKDQKKKTQKFFLFPWPPTFGAKG